MVVKKKAAVKKKPAAAKKAVVKKVPVKEKEYAAKQGTIAFFSRPANQARFCDLLRTGIGKGDACRAMKITAQTFQGYRRRDPEFAADVAAAIEESAEPVLRKMRDQALEGDTASARIFLDHTIKKEASEVNHNHMLTVDPEMLDSIEGLEQILLARTTAGALEHNDFVEAEVLELEQ